VRTIILTIIVLGVAPAVLTAQDARFCLIGAPRPKCSTFLVTEAGVATSLESPTHFYPSWEIGVLRNTGRGSAIGPTFFAAGLDNNARFAVKLRYRRWLAHGLHAEVAPGFMFYNDTFGARDAGIVGHVAFGYREWVAGTLQLESFQHEMLGRQTETFIGVRAGSYVGAAGDLLGVALVVIAAIVSSKTS
jgi:hypothetical protein